MNIFNALQVRILIGAGAALLVITTVAPYGAVYLLHSKIRSSAAESRQQVEVDHLPQP